MKPTTKTPYRAIILGEETIVQDWNDSRIITASCEFTMCRLEGEDVRRELPSLVAVSVERPLPLGSLIEVATIRMDQRQEWLLNDHKLSILCQLPAGQRLLRLTTSEVLRVRRREIQAVAWFRTCCHSAETSELDRVLADWREARKRNPAKARIDLSWLNNAPFGWSAPVWLDRFEPIDAQKTPVQDEEDRIGAEVSAAALVKVMMAIGERLDPHSRVPPPATLLFRYLLRDGMTTHAIHKKHPSWAMRTIRLRKKQLMDFLAKRFPSFSLDDHSQWRRLFEQADALFATHQSRRRRTAPLERPPG